MLFFNVSVSGSTPIQVNMAATVPISPEEQEELREAFAKIGNRIISSCVSE